MGLSVRGVYAEKRIYVSRAGCCDIGGITAYGGIDAGAGQGAAARAKSGVLEQPAADGDCGTR